MLEKAAGLVYEDREAVKAQGQRPPDGAEYLDLLRAVAGLGADTEAQEDLLDELRDFALRKHPAGEGW